MNKLFFLLIGILLVINSCDTDDIDTEIDLIENNWKVLKIKEPGELSYRYATESYIFNFENDSVFTFNLDVNSCGGEYKIINAGNIEFGSAYCTEMCCDSEFAVDLRQLIHQMTSYYGRGNQLVLKGEGEIIFERY